MKANKTIYLNRLEAERFLALKNPAQLSALLGMDINALHGVVSAPGYKTFRIPKKSGGVREINAPAEPLVRIQRALNKYLQAVYNYMLPDCSFGFIAKLNTDNYISSPLYEIHKVKRGIVGNARRHVGKEYVLNIDIADFFPSISAVRVRDLFMKEPFAFGLELATCLALICTYNRKLPAGAPSSPVLSNLVCLSLDKVLREYSLRSNLVYTRYADDLTFSCDGEIPAAALEKICCVIRSHDFVINSKKYRLQKCTARQEVTGIKVNEKLNVDRRYIRNLRAVLYDIRKNGKELAAAKYFKLNETLSPELIEKFLRSVEGKINYVGEVRGRRDAVYLKLFYSLIESSK